MKKIYVIFMFMALPFSNIPIEASDRDILSISGDNSGSPSSPGGTIKVFGGVNVNTGNGEDGDLIQATTLTSNEYFYRQVVNKDPSLPLTFQISGDVTIHCQYIFSAIVTVLPGSNVKIYAGQPIQISPESELPLPNNEYIVRPHSVNLNRQSDNSDSYNFEFHTTANGNINVSLLAALGGDSDNNDLNGGNGGLIQITNDNHKINLTYVSVTGGKGDDGHEDGGYGKTGGNGGQIAIRAKEIELSFFAVSATGGSGGNGDSTDVDEATAGSGGEGGAGGKILLEAENIFTNFPPMPGLYAIYAGGGSGGNGGDAWGIDTIGGNGGNGGAPGDVVFTNASCSSVQIDPGPGGSGGYGSLEEGENGSEGTGTSPVELPTLPPELQEDDWTIMLYLAADDPEAGRSKGEGMILRALFDMEKVNLSDTSVNIVGFLDRNPAPEDRGIFNPIHWEIPYGEEWGTWADSRQGWITYNGNGIFSDILNFLGFKPHFSSVFTTVNDVFPELDMAEPSTLISFVQWAKEEAPAKNYAFIYFGHSVGWRGAVFDSEGPLHQIMCLSPYMSLPSFASAMKQAAQLLPKGKFDVFVNFGCSSMCIESLTQLSGAVDYFVGSPHSVDYYDYNCTKWLDIIKNNPNLSSSAFAQTIHTSASMEESTLVLMNEVPLLVSSLESLANAIISASPEQREIIKNHLPLTSDFSYWSNTDKDLTEVLSILTTDDDIESSVRTKAILAQYYNNNAVLGKSSIYFPIPKPGITDYNIHPDYPVLAFAQPSGITIGANWLDLLLSFGAYPNYIKILIDPGDTMMTALNLNQIHNSKLVLYSFIDTISDIDFFEFSAQANSLLSINSSSQNGTPLQLSIMDNQGAIINQITAPSGMVYMVLPQDGNYYVSIQPGSVDSTHAMSNTSFEDAYGLSLLTSDLAALNNALTATPDVIDFGNVIQYGAENEYVILSNQSHVDIPIDSFLFNGWDFSAQFPDHPLPFILEAGMQCKIEVIAHPHQLGAINDVVTIKAKEPIPAQVQIQLHANSMESIVGDINKDKSVNLFDFSLMSFFWNCNCNPDDPISLIDLDKNGTINMTDLVLLFTNWMKSLE